MHLTKLLRRNINWVAAVLSVVGIILNGNRFIICWPVWIIADLCWIAYSLPKRDWAYVVLWIVFLAANVYGWYQWAHLP